MTTSSEQAHGISLTPSGPAAVDANVQAPGRFGKITGRVLIYVTLAVAAVIFSLPWTWMILSALKSNVDIHSLPIAFFPRGYHWDNFIKAFFPAFGSMRAGEVAATSIWPRLLFNTLVIAAFVELGTLLSSSLVAFSFSHLHWRGRNTMFYFVLASMMLPAQVTLIPQYLIFTKIFQWTNTWYPQIVPAFFGAGASIFLLRQFMMTIPVEIDEAARLDGCSDLQLFWHVILPMTKAGLGAIAIFTFTFVWNDLFTPLLYIRDANLGNMATGMSSLSAAVSLYGERFPRDELTMAAAVIVSLPLVIMFFIFQKQYIQGVVITGIK
jgi:ABC-type glycerol-3-phosphate transport system permease component